MLETESLLLNTEYVDWLVRITLDMNYFTDEEKFNINPDDLSQSDIQFIKRLSELYFGIDKYALENDGSKYLQIGGYYYYFKYNNIGFKIGVREVLDDISFYCERLEFTDEDFIDIKDVIDSCVKENDLQKLSISIKDLYNRGFSINEIRNEISKTLIELRKKEKNSVHEHYLGQEERDIDRAVKTLSKFKK